ncbi:hypothetical protein E2C01_043078 [Portunus trituberculatus]|uniref:Uncharacterized protein n=1 Tax=Portunus trituberculatus TaxID=210409 RepID=A0A5B7FNH4_PORTR|nr:hypothetical protein [Portunus trituberculatus]
MNSNNEHLIHFQKWSIDGSTAATVSPLHNIVKEELNQESYLAYLSPLPMKYSHHPLTYSFWEYM